MFEIEARVCMYFSFGGYDRGAKEAPISWCSSHYRNLRHWQRRPWPCRVNDILTFRIPHFTVTHIRQQLELCPPQRSTRSQAQPRLVPTMSFIHPRPQGYDYDYRRCDRLWFIPCRGMVAHRHRRPTIFSVLSLAESTSAWPSFRSFHALLRHKLSYANLPRSFLPLTTMSCHATHLNTK